ncbi:hypothetical protein [Tardiphaga sp. 841_E9_N1_2]|uniref:hypothetical protein n=1 Tax=Tardiphaga sp. 841_E9_N1_2 TaxID=3240762 RepID=UPI003F26F501
MTKKVPAAVIDKSDERWHVDRKIPVALLVGFFLTIGSQTSIAIWWASKADSRIERLEQQTTATAPQGDRLTKVETRLEAVQDGISEIKSILRKEPFPTKMR